MCTNTSAPPSSGWMKPKPLVALNHFTVPVCMGSSLSEMRTRARRGAERSNFRRGSMTYPAAEPQDSSAENQASQTIFDRLDVRSSVRHDNNYYQKTEPCAGFMLKSSACEWFLIGRS